MRRSISRMCSWHPAMHSSVTDCRGLLHGGGGQRCHWCRRSGRWFGKRHGCRGQLSHGHRSGIDRGLVGTGCQCTGREVATGGR